VIRFSLDLEDHLIDWPNLLSPGREGNPGEVERELTGFPQSSQLVLSKKQLERKTNPPAAVKEKLEKYPSLHC